MNIVICNTDNMPTLYYFNVSINVFERTGLMRENLTENCKHFIENNKSVNPQQTIRRMGFFSLFDELSGANRALNKTN